MAIKAMYVNFCETWQKTVKRVKQKSKVVVVGSVVLFWGIGNVIVWLLDAGSYWKVMRRFVCLKLCGTLPQNMSSQLILFMETHWTRWSQLTRQLETWYALVLLIVC